MVKVDFIEEDLLESFYGRIIYHFINPDLEIS